MTVEYTDIYQTIEGPSFGEFKDRGSKFLAYAFPVEDTDQIQAALLEVRKEHPKARHHCYGYRLGLDQYNYRANDDGEPSGTAGRPILGQIDSAELTNTLVVVVRYFGGTLLGASGLINAYKKSAADALAAGVKVEKLVEDVYTLRFDYAHMSKVMNAVSKPPFQVIEQRFTITAELDVSVRQSLAEEALKQLKAQVAEVYLEEVDGLEEIEGFDLEHAYTR
ncbi:IMPACT family protein [Lewinella cohaerens]|uniref:IMPACT family protein n=1 Tax=Lewinella cohaerens TaxID=70995 RepID=UPI00037B3EAA|nr:YigZ family protein [Lewinella cohaerens]